MNITAETLLGQLPSYRDEWVVIHPDQSVKDIIAEVLDAHKEFAPYYDNIALFFDDDNVEDISRNLYEFCKANIRYKEESKDDQTTAIPAGILTRRCGDCKHYASFCGGVLDGLGRLTGKKIKWSYRFASYNLFDNTPHHVFIVIDDDGKEIWIDPTPGADAQDPVWMIDKKVKASTMPLRRNIAGFNVASVPIDTVYVSDRLPVFTNEELDPVIVEIIEEQNADEEITAELQNAIEILMHYQVMNDQGEVSATHLQELAKVLPVDEFELVANAFQTLQIELEKVATVGSFFSTLWRGVKKVTLALPRNAYLSLVAINAFGYATKLRNAIYNIDNTFFQPGQQKLYNWWNKVGGDWHNLKLAIDSGSKKRALLGQIDFDRSEDVMAIRDRIGVAPAIPAWVAIASALIAAITPLIKEILRQKQAAGQLPLSIDPNTGLPYGVNPGADPYGSSSGNVFDKVLNFVKENPLPVAVFVGGVIYYITDKKKRRRQTA